MGALAILAGAIFLVTDSPTLSAMTGSVNPDGPEIVDLVPANGTVAHPPAAGITFRAVSWNRSQRVEFGWW